MPQVEKVLVGLMRTLVISAALVVGCAAVCFSQNPTAPVLCVSAITDTPGKSIGPLGNLNDQLARDISDRKPLKGLAIAADPTGHALPSPECDYLLEITLHVGGETGIALNPPKANPLDPGIDPRRATSGWLVQAFYHLKSTPNAAKSIRFDDDARERYEPNVGGYGTNVGSVARRVARTAASDAAGRLKKKLRI